MRKRGKTVEKMGRAPCCNKGEVKKGAWTPEEDKILVDYITKNGHGTWRSFPKLAGLQRCGKSCRLRWTNYLRPDIKRGAFSFEEEQTILELHSLHGNKWAAIASRLPGRTDNEIKNYWNSHLRKRIPDKGHAGQTNASSESTDTKSTLPPTHHMAEWENTRVEAEAESEAGLSLDPMLRGTSDSNNFLYAWGPGVGEEFQKPMDFDKVASVIPTPQPSSAIKGESDSVGTAQAGSWFTLTSTSESCDQSVKGHMRVKDEAEEAMNVCISQSSYEAENSSDLTLDLLLDFPNDGEYLEYV